VESTRLFEFGSEAAADARGDGQPLDLVQGRAVGGKASVADHGVGAIEGLAALPRAR